MSLLVRASVIAPTLALALFIGAACGESKSDAPVEPAIIASDASIDAAPPPPAPTAPPAPTVAPDAGAATCSNGLLDGNEVDVDCGGACASCGTGKRCESGASCASGVCKTDKCEAPSCTDGVKNGTESDLDCGGTCKKCSDAKSCASASDCASGLCTLGKCAPAACGDGLKNGVESDVDCGGVCGKCAQGKLCSAATDCDSASCAADCSSGVCTAPVCAACQPGSKEACGGACSKRCGTGSKCTVHADCAGPWCDPVKKECAATLPPGPCQMHRLAFPSAPTGVYSLSVGGSMVSVYCDMSTDGGGWTLAMKVVGTSSTLRYDSPLWTDEAELNPTSTNLSAVDAKFAVFSHSPFQSIRLTVVDAGTARSVIVARPAMSLRSVFTGAQSLTSLGRYAWYGLVENPSLQYNCNREGFNLTGSYQKVRFGILGNNENDCLTADSFIGIGAGQGSQGQACGFGTISSGNQACVDTENGDRFTPAFAYLMIK